MPWVFVAVTAVGLAGLLAGERSGSRLRFIAKPLASIGFVGLAVTLGAFESTYGRWILVGLVLGWIGDVALLGKSGVSFLTGLVAFLLGHVGYVIAFVISGLSSNATWAASIGTAAAAVLVFRWLRPHLPGGMAGPVTVYVVIISAMLATAMGAWAAGATWHIPVGAAAFSVSDLSVARDRFISAGFGNRLWGLPLYYAGQLLLAWSVTS